MDVQEVMEDGGASVEMPLWTKPLSLLDRLQDHLDRLQDHLVESLVDLSNHDEYTTAVRPWQTMKLLTMKLVPRVLWLLESLSVFITPF